MKKTLLVLLAGMFIAAGASAQNYYLAEQQARRASQQNAAEQQRIANAAGNGSAGQSSQAAPTTQADPALQATLSNIASLQADLAAFVNADQPDAAQKNTLLNNMSEAAQGKKASPDSAKELAKDLQSALAGKKSLAAAQQKQLAQFIHAAFNGSHLTDAQTDKISAAVQKTLTDAGVSSDDAINIVTDLKKVIADTK